MKFCFRCPHMSDTTAQATLPEVALADLPEATKDYLISLHVSTGRPIAELVREILNRMANPEKRATV